MTDKREVGTLVPQAGGGALLSGRKPGYSNPTAGRPTNLTPEVHKQITEDIAGGMYAQVAAARAGITEQTFYTWLKRGQEEESGVYREFTECVLTSAGEAEKNATDSVQSRFGDDWKSAAWWLERRFPKRWGKQQRLEISTTPDMQDEW